MSQKQINKEVKDLLNSFLEEHIYPKILDKDNFLGAVTYGSSVTGFSSKNSDIDLLVLLNHAECTTRGVKIYNGYKVEYFIKPIEKFLSETISYSNSNCPTQVALEQNAYILSDRFGFIENILKTSADYYNQHRQKPNKNYDLKFVQIENRLASLKNILERNGAEFHMVYYNVLEMLREWHSQSHDEADIPFAKAYRIYTDKAYYDKFVSNNAGNPMPDKKFVELYAKCVKQTTNKPKMLHNLQSLYDYEKSFISLNPTDYEIELR